MSEMWTQLMTGESQKLTRLISVGKVKLSRSTGDMEINFNAQRLLTGRECQLIESTSTIPPSRSRRRWILTTIRASFSTACCA